MGNYTEIESGMVFTSWASRGYQTFLGTAKGTGDASAAVMGTCVAYCLISLDHKVETAFTLSFCGAK